MSMKIQDEIIEKYKEQVQLLKSINETNERLIDKYKESQKGYEAYIELLKGQVETLQTLLIDKI